MHYRSEVPTHSQLPAHLHNWHMQYIHTYILTIYYYRITFSTFNNMLISTGRSESDVTGVKNSPTVCYTEDDLLELTSAEFSNTRNDMVATCREV